MPQFWEGPGADAVRRTRAQTGCQKAFATLLAKPFRSVKIHQQFVEFFILQGSLTAYMVFNGFQIVWNISKVLSYHTHTHTRNVASTFLKDLYTIYWLYMSVQFLHILVLLPPIAVFLPGGWILFKGSPIWFLSPRLFVFEVPALFEVQILVSHCILVQSQHQTFFGGSSSPWSIVNVVQCRVSGLEHLNSDLYPAW